ncbi:MAG: hypothetical protein AB7N76_17325 [Planctomycetota bacterium]
MNAPEHALPVQSLQVVLHGTTSLPVFALHQVMLDGMILGVGGALHMGQTLRADLHHPLWPRPLVVQVRVGWCRPFGPQHYVAGMELVGTWEALGVQRRALAPVLGSVANGLDRPLGFVLRAPRELVCTDPFTQRLAVIVLEGGAFVVHRRDGTTLGANGLGEALRLAYETSADPWLEPPLPGLGAGGARAGAAPSAPPIPDLVEVDDSDEDEDDDLLGVLPAQPHGVVTEEDVVLGMNTVVIGPDRLEPPPPRPKAKPAQEEVFDMNTIVLPPPSDDETARVLRAASGSDSRVLGADTVALRQGGPSKGGNASAVLEAGQVVGYLVPTGMEMSWSLYDPTGTKVAMLAADGDCVRVCAMGRNAKDDLSFLEAPNGNAALAKALCRRGPFQVDPGLPGLL